MHRIQPRDGGLQYVNPLEKNQLQSLAKEPPGRSDTSIDSRQPLDDLCPDCDQTVYTYKIRLNDGSTRYLRIRSTGPEAPPTASYGAGLDELVECKVGEDYVMTQETVLVETVHGSFWHESGKAPVWITEHEAVEILAKPKTNRAEVALRGSRLYKIKLDDNSAYFCLVEGYKTALHGQDVENLEDSKLLEEVIVYRDGGTLSVQSDHGDLGVPSPQDQNDAERPEWDARHKIEQLEGPGLP